MLMPQPLPKILRQIVFPIKINVRQHHSTTNSKLKTIMTTHSIKNGIPPPKIGERERKREENEYKFSQETKIWNPEPNKSWRLSNVSN